MIAVINRLYRRIFCRGGHGVHSPFVFDLLTTVIEEKCFYYCYDSLSPVRAQLRQNVVTLRSRGHEYAVNDYLKRFCFSESEDKLLFRLANRFKPEVICVAGSDLGLAPVYLTAYSKSVRCIVIEPEADVAAVAQSIVDKYSTSVGIHSSGEIDTQDKGSIDLFVLGKCSPVAFDEAVQYMNDESLMVISGINASRESRAKWKNICVHPRVTVTLDLYSLGLVFFNPNLHRKTYKSFVL